MAHQKNKLILFPFVFISLASCANSPQKVGDMNHPKMSLTEEVEGRRLNNAAAKEVQAYNFVEINFNRASSTLTKNATSSLDAVIEQAKQQGKINQIMVLSWADQEYPSKKRGKLSYLQSSLAEKRNVAIKKYFSAIQGVDVDTYNMAERPKTLSKWFNTTDSKLKNSLMAAGLPTTSEEPQYASKASRAVIFIKVD